MSITPVSEPVLKRVYLCSVSIIECVPRVSGRQWWVGIITLVNISLFCLVEVMYKRQPYLINIYIVI